MPLTLVDTRWMHLDLSRADTGRLWLRWMVARWQGCVFRGPFWWDWAWFGAPGERWLHAGPLVCGAWRDAPGACDCE